MRRVWNWLMSQLDRVPSGWGIPLMVVFGLVFWIVVLKLAGL